MFSNIMQQDLAKEAREGGEGVGEGVGEGGEEAGAVEGPRTSL